MREYNVINDKLTFYNFDQNGITADINKFFEVVVKKIRSIFIFKLYKKKETRNF